MIRKVIHLILRGGFVKTGKGETKQGGGGEWMELENKSYKVCISITI